MSPLLASYVVIASIATVVACHHLIVWLRRRDLRTHLDFALLAAVLAVHDLLYLLRFQRLEPELVRWLDWSQWASELLALWLLLAFVARFTRQDQPRFRRVVALGLTAIGLIHVVTMPVGFARTDDSRVQPIELLTGEFFHGIVGSLSWAYAPFAALVLAVLGWSLVAAWRHVRDGYRLRGWALLAALLVVCAAVVNSIVFNDLLDYASVQFIDHSFVALAVVMSLLMADEMVLSGRLQGQLASREADLRSTLDAISDGVIAVDHTGRIVRVNPAAKNLLATGKDLVGRPVREVFRIADRDEGRSVALPLDALLAGQAQPAGDPVSLDAAAGRIRDVQIAGAPVRRRDGVVTGAVLVIRDVTDRLELEEQLLQSRKMDALGQLAGGIAHDFNNMLSGIMGGAELLILELADQSALRERAELIADSAERAGELTQQLLAFARRGKMVKRPMSVHDCIESAIALFRGGSAGAIAIGLELRAQHDVVRGDAAMFQNAILNLAVNARDAMSAGGTLSVRTVERDQGERRMIEIEVSDTGSGMSPEVRERIFEPFFTTKQEGLGIGLGLAAVYGTVQAMGGDIRCDSEPGRGTTFTISLPTAGDTVTVTRRIRTPRHGAGRILVVDDEAVVRLTTTAMLESMGYQVDAVEDGAAALERFGDGADYDMVVLDVVMPGMRGDEVYHRLKRRRPDMRCVVVSGYTRDASIDQMREDGVEVVLIKPFRIDDLASAVKRAIC